MAMGPELLDRGARLYEDDYYAWAQAQAQALRGLAAARWNGPLDLENLAEEVEGLARHERKTVSSQVGRAIEHLLKLQFSRQAQPRRQWANSVDDARVGLGEDLTRTLRQDLEASLPRIYVARRRKLARKLLRDGDAEAAAALPEACPYTLDQLLDEDWWPPEPPPA